MARFFSTAGPTIAGKHYAIDPLARLQRNDVLALIQQKRYFVLHGPRLTGKSSALWALVCHLNELGTHTAVYINLRQAQRASGDANAGIHTILGQLERWSRLLTAETRVAQWQAQALSSGDLQGAFSRVLAAWAENCDTPLVVVMDDIDSLVGDTLVSVLHQLRAGYDARPAHFPQSVVLCGVRDVRDCRIRTSANEIVTGSSVFNIEAESLQLGDFSENELRELYAQHTAETGQRFDEDVLSTIWGLTGGQPALVNLLADEVCFKVPRGRDRTRPINVELLARATVNLLGAEELGLPTLG